MRAILLLIAFLPATAFAQQKKILYMGDADVAQQLQGISPKANIVVVTNDNVMREITDADAFIGTIKPEYVHAGKKLKWTQIMSAGVETVLHKSGSDALKNSDIILTNNQIVQGPEIADHALAMLLALTRGLHTFIDHRLSEKWQPRPYPGIELSGRNGVVIGCGGIGSQIALRAWAFGMNITCVDPEDIPFSPFIKRTVKPDLLDEVLPSADVVFISAPHTEKSHKMMGPKQFDLMKKDSFFIAVSRGGIYDLPALIKALDSKKLSGAGVDVTDPEPLPAGNALWKFSNAIITPHIAGRSDKDRARMIGTIQENVRRFVDGKPLLNVVDKQKGY
ncbi:MAG: D-2-hydroxyacid dehydrogenase [Acidobacteria bacterium]|nr:D-2-hydroxyacid dehydrogenase [Acidobacteriota bacterium]